VTLTPTQIHESLDTQGLLDDSRGPGVYALEVTTPADPEAVARAWLAVVDAAPPEGTFARLAADRVAYVGASDDVYARLADHARGAVRQATFLEVFDPVDVVGVWPDPDPFQTAERERARALSREGWVCWCDGEIL
jgi:predicted GIY-YIG superfamily endonuclease